MIVVIPCSWPNGKSEAAEKTDLEWLPRSCPRCAAPVIGHGRRNKQAHDENRSGIRVRRGICKGCGKTITVLPAWSLPYTRYSLYARQQAVNRWIAGARLEDASPLVQDPDCVADPSTLRRWMRRRMAGLWRSIATLRMGTIPPTIFAWDWRAATGMLVPEAKPA